MFAINSTYFRRVFCSSALADFINLRQPPQRHRRAQPRRGVVGHYPFALPRHHVGVLGNRQKIGPFREGEASAENFQTVVLKLIEDFTSLFPWDSVEALAENFVPARMNWSYICCSGQSRAALPPTGDSGLPQPGPESPDRI